MHFPEDFFGNVVNYFLLFTYFSMLCQKLSLQSLGMESNYVASSGQALHRSSVCGHPPLSLYYSELSENKSESINSQQSYAVDVLWMACVNA